MKKVLAIMLCAVLMTSACAFTASPAGGHSYTLSDVLLDSNGQPLDMSDITVCLDVSDGEPGALLLHMQSAGETVGAIGFTSVDGLNILHLESPTIGHKDYAIDPVKELARSLDNIRNALVESLQGADTDALARLLMGAADSVEAAETDEAEEAEEAAESFHIPTFDVSGDLSEALEGCVNDSETVTLEGYVVELGGKQNAIPDGDYVKSSFTIDNEHLVKLLNMVTVDGKPMGAGTQVAESGSEMELTGEFYKGEDASFGSVTLGVAESESDIHTGFGFVSVPTENGHTTTISLGSDLNGAATSLGFTVGREETTDVAFGPDEVDMDSVILLSDMDEEEGRTMLSEDLSALLSDVMGAVLEPLMAAMPQDDASVEVTQEN